MRQLRRSRFVHLAGAAVLLGTPAGAGAQSPAVLRVAGNPGDSYAESVYANDQGFFQKAGLNVELTVLRSAALISPSVASGALDIGVSNVLPIALAYLRGIDFAFFCSGGMYNPDGAALCVRADGPIKTPKDLEGQVIGTSALTDFSTLAIQEWIDRNGANSAAVRFVEVPASEMQSALMRGTVGAVPLFEPFLTVAKKAGGLRLVIPHLYEVFGQGFMVSGYFARAGWLSANPLLARRFASAIYDTGRWATTYPAESAGVLIKVGNLDPAIAREMVRVPYGRTLVPSMIQPTLDIAYKHKSLSRRLRAEELIVRV